MCPCNSRARLEELPFESWLDLQNMFICDWPKHFLAFESIKNYAELKKSGKVTDSKILVLDGEWSDGTFILQDDEDVYIIIYTLEESCERLKTALRLLDWRDGPRIHPYLGRFKSALNAVYDELNLPVLYDGDMLWHWIHRDDANKFSLEQSGVYLASLREHDADYINQFWPHKYPGSENWLRSLIRNNTSRGVFLKENDKLVAWVMRMNNGIVTSLHTHPDHTRKGYGSLALRAIAKANAEAGSDTVGCIVDGNHRSTALFDKLGFKSQGPMHWARTAPLTKPKSRPSCSSITEETARNHRQYSS